MTPDLAQLYATNQRSGYTVALGKVTDLASIARTCFKCVSDVQNLIFCQLCLSLFAAPFDAFWMQNRIMSIAASRTSFVDHVVHVVVVGSEEKVRRIYTQAIITRVADKEPIRYRANNKLVSISVGAHGDTNSNCEMTVTAFGGIGFPDPARAGLFYLCPEAHRTHSESMHGSTLYGTKYPALQTVAGEHRTAIGALASHSGPVTQSGYAVKVDG